MSLRFTTFIVWTTLGEIIFQAEIFSLEIWQQLELTSTFLLSQKQLATPLK